MGDEDEVGMNYTAAVGDLARAAIDELRRQLRDGIYPESASVCLAILELLHNK